MKNFKSLSKFLISVLMLVAILGISLSNVSMASSDSPWDYSSTPERAIYYRQYSVMTGNDVKWVQQALNITINVNLNLDGSFGPACKTAVTNFQRNYGLYQDGSFGSGTRSKMVSVLNSMGYSDNSSSGTAEYKLVWPTERTSITGMYGEKASRRGSGYNQRYHSGIDIGSVIGDDVYSIADGKVIDIGYTNARGNYVIVYHENLDISSLYEHLDTTKVYVGKDVSARDIIATSGNSGKKSDGGSYPSHLHFGITKGKMTNLSYDLWYVRTPNQNNTIEPDPNYNNKVTYTYL